MPPVVLELLLEEELLEEDELLDEELDELDELEAPLEELLLDEDEDELLVPPPVVIAPAEAVSVTRSSFAPSSRRSMRKVCDPAFKPLNVAGVRLA